MSTGLRPRPKLHESLGMSLRVKVALGVALPILLVMTLLSFVRVWRERQLLEDQLERTASQLGEVMMGSLHHALLTNDRERISQSLSDMGAIRTVRQIQLVDLDGRVTAGSHSEQVGTVWRLDERGCIECHQFSAASRPGTTRFSALDGVLRISTPIPNEPECSACHAQEGACLGVLLADLSILDLDAHLRNDLFLDLATSIGSTVLVILALYLLIHWLVVRRVETWVPPLTEFAAGDFSARLPVSAASPDELSALAKTFNCMAGTLDRHAREQEERGRLRQRVIVEERKRIARELHDGLSQLLGYVNTKAMAARLMLKKGQPEVTEQYLLQLEEAARELSVDMREAILDLKRVEQSGTGLAATLEDAVAQFIRLSGLPVELAIAPEIHEFSLPAGTELQLLRIAQESLTNVHKHASATRVWVALQVKSDVIELTVGDNGRGFDPDQTQATDQPHFGLSTMRERTEAIGAEFDLDSKPGRETRATVRLAFKSLPGAQQEDPL